MVVCGSCKKEKKRKMEDEEEEAWESGGNAGLGCKSNRLLVLELPLLVCKGFMCVAFSHVLLRLYSQDYYYY